MENDNNSNSNTQLAAPTIKAFLTLLMPASVVAHAGTPQPRYNVRTIAQELREDIALLKEKILLKQSGLKEQQEEEAETDVQEEVITTIKAHGMIHHLKHTKNSIASN